MKLGSLFDGSGMALPCVLHVLSGIKETALRGANSESGKGN